MSTTLWDEHRRKGGVAAPVPLHGKSARLIRRIPKVPSVKAFRDYDTGENKKMSTKGTFLSGEAVGHRVSRALRAIHPKNTEKLVWRDLKGAVSERTIKTYIAYDERAPRAEILLLMFDAYGESFMAAIGGDAEWAKSLRLKADVAALKAKLAEVQQTLDTIGAGFVEGDD